MKTHEFFATYANTPLYKRLIPINIIQHGLLTISGVYQQMKKTEEQMRPLRIEQDKLLQIADEFYATTKV